MTGAANVKGDRILLVSCADAHTKLAVGDLGTVTSVDDLGTVHVRWDSGSQLGLIPGEDHWETLAPASCLVRDTTDGKPCLLDAGHPGRHDKGGRRFDRGYTLAAELRMGDRVIVGGKGWVMRMGAYPDPPEGPMVRLRLWRPWITPAERTSVIDRPDARIPHDDPPRWTP